MSSSPTLLASVEATPEQVNPPAQQTHATYCVGYSYTSGNGVKGRSISSNKEEVAAVSHGMALHPLPLAVWHGIIDKMQEAIIDALASVLKPGAALLSFNWKIP